MAPEHEITTPKVAVLTTSPTRPLPPDSHRSHITTPRLLLRPLNQDDLQALHALRTQPEAMTGTSLGIPDKTIDDTQLALDYFLPPNDTTAFLYGIFLLSTGELIGEGGVHELDDTASGWPELGYKFRKEAWGHGYATEFLGAFLAAWWDLHREAAEISVHPASVERGPDGEGEVREMVFANAELDNRASQRVLEKVGFVRFCEWTEPDTQLHRLGEPLTLVGYVHSGRRAP